MPTVISESDSFAATVSRPNNGEPADAASINAYETVDASRDRYLYNRSLTSMLFDVKRVGFGAVGNGSTDDAAAIQAAINAAAAINAGVVVLPAGSFKINSGLTLPKGVSLCGVPGYTSIYLNHSSANLITLSTGIYSGHPQIISGIAFEGSIANSGTVIYDSGAATRGLKVVDCSYNYSSANLQGRFFRCDGNAASSFLLDNINARIVAGGAEFVSVGTGGDIAVRAGRVAVPATWAGNCISIGSNVRARISGIRFDGASYTTGGGSFTYAGAGSNVVITGCIFDANGGSGGLIAINFSAGGSGALLNACGNQFIACSPYSVGASAVVGSVLELVAYGTATTASATLFTIPDGYKSYLLRTNSDTPIRFPNGLFAGQEFEFSLYNYNAVSTIAPSLSTTPVTGNPVPTVVSFKMLSGIFVWQDRDASGTYRWVQQGLWSFNGGTIV